MAHLIFKTWYKPVIHGKKPCVRLRDWKERPAKNAMTNAINNIPKEMGYSYTVIQR